MLSANLINRECPADLKEGICSLIFAAPRCSELPELSRMRDLFEKKYGKDFVAAAVDLRPNACVNNLVSVNILFCSNFDYWVLCSLLKLMTF